MPDDSMPGRNRQRRLLQFSLALVGSSVLLAACQKGAPQLPAQPTLPAPNAAGQPQADQQAEAAKLAQQRIEQAALKQGWSAGHRATVTCLQGERAQTDGNELRCEDQAYVEQNYRSSNNR
ncbi:hypothetical protein KBY57_08415 [Cyanobium sp. Aljojuca 7D2]|uniref:hypothetical protein n=1 Tax=Cyanobium sp. Aljojuca 7D2 TaxID=2823698 RepID=UPI0020CE50BA|nr:hypothetical protein [Cyanobium sp. Aljojuca 7D2]MCP9891076.1 hypothetical protein [Cyanobium sp. Aljojuca 7D2]